MSVKNPANDDFIKKWAAYAKAKGSCRSQGQAADQRPDGSHLHRHLHVEAGRRKRPRSTDTDKVIAAMAGQTFKAPAASPRRWTKNHHLHKPVFIGEDQGRRPVQRGLEDQGPGQGAALEPVHPRQRQEKDEPTARPRFSPLDLTQA